MVNVKDNGVCYICGKSLGNEFDELVSVRYRQNYKKRLCVNCASTVKMYIFDLKDNVLSNKGCMVR